jgi:hypothetical protein
MRILVAMTLFAIGCGPAPKKESSIVQETDAAPTCCCKTLPTTAEKEIIPNYNIVGRMECSGAHGDCVDDVQCAGQEAERMQSDDGVPAPPVLEPSTSSFGDE